MRMRKRILAMLLMVFMISGSILPAAYADETDFPDDQVAAAEEPEDMYGETGSQSDEQGMLPDLLSDDVQGGENTEQGYAGQDPADLTAESEEFASDSVFSEEYGMPEDPVPGQASQQNYEVQKTEDPAAEPDTWTDIEMTPYTVYLEQYDLWLEESGEELLWKYLDEALIPQPVNRGESAGWSLTDMDLLIFNRLKENISDVAGGYLFSTEFFLSMEDLQISEEGWTAEDLGVEEIVGENGISEEAVEAAIRLLDFDTDRIFSALCADCPFDLYWLDKDVSVEIEGPGVSASYASESGEWELFFTDGMTFRFPVSADFAEGQFLTDSRKTTAVAASVETAAAIVNSYESCDDLTKLEMYRQEICGRTSYNDDAVSTNAPYGNPWQLIWVFDNDPSTNVVCEGYAKAFQYLCDMSTFASPMVESRLVSGFMTGGIGAGAHMWNLVTLDDGRNYLVDVTNCDTGTVGEERELFLAGLPEDGTENSVEDGYTLYANGQAVRYEYDEDTFSLYEISALELAAGSYSGPEIHPAPKAAATSSIKYVLNERGNFSGRTREELVSRYSAALNAGPSYANWDKNTYYDVPASVKAPYAAGQLTRDTLLAMQEMTSFYRWLTGVEPLQESCAHSADLQAGALIRNFDFDHYVDSSAKPEDMPADLWDQGANVWHNIIAMGYTPQGCINGWINEGYNPSSGWGTLGHRYALISSGVSGIQFGYAGTVGIGVDTSYNNPDYPSGGFSAFPAPGYMPDKVISPAYAAWSLDFDPDIVTVEKAENVKVTITNTSSGEKVVRSTEDNTLQAGSDFIWFAQPACSSSYYSGLYEVSITGLKDSQTGKAAEIVYTIEFTDVTGELETCVEYADACDYSELIIYKTLNSTAALKKIAAVLPDEITVSCVSGHKLSIPVSGHWVLDEKNACFVNSASADELPANVSDPNHVLDRITVGYTISEDYYDSYNYLILPANPVKGKGGTVKVYRTMASSDISRVFRILKNNDGTYSGEKWLDSETSDEFDAQASEDQFPFHVYNIASFKPEDSGEYVSVYFNSASWDDTAYVSTQIQQLTVRDTDISKAVITNVKDKTFTGSAIAQDPVIKMQGVQLKKNSDYSLTYHKNAEVGMAEVIITGKGDYTGSVAVPFRIRFRDVEDPKLFYYDPVYWAADGNITTGWPDGTFRPLNNCNRAAVVTFLWRLAGQPEVPVTDAFTDLTGNPDFDKAISWAVETGITTGWSDGTFRPWNTCNRAAIVTFLWRYAGMPDAASEAAFTDLTGNPDFDAAISWASEKGITTGWSDNTFRPWNTCNRLAIVSFLYRYAKL